MNSAISRSLMAVGDCPHCMSWWNVFQWKSKTSTANDPTFTLNVGNRSTGEMYFYLYNHLASRSYGQSTMNIPVGRWFQVEAFYSQAADNTGQVTFWQDGTKILDVTGVQTRRSGDQIQWSVDNYTDNLNPPNATLYVDDAAISLTRLGPGGSTSPSAAISTLSAGPVAHWKTDAGSGSATADSSGNGNTSYLNNGPARITGYLGDALSFDGSNNYVQANDGDTLSPLTSTGEMIVAPPG